MWENLPETKDNKNLVNGIDTLCITSNQKDKSEKRNGTDSVS